jgi:hypothetical protein
MLKSTKLLFVKIVFFQVIFFSAYCMMTHVIVYYTTLHLFIRKLNMLTIPFIGMSGFALTYTMVLEISIIKCAVVCVDQTKITRVLINKILNLYYKSDLADALNMFSRQISRRKINIRNAFFVIDWTLLFSMISSILAFLIVTFQVGESYDEAFNQTNNTKNLSKINHL